LSVCFISDEMRKDTYLSFDRVGRAVVWSW
jgi:hypothetical protein